MGLALDGRLVFPGFYDDTRDLPLNMSLQAPTKYEPVVNFKTVKAMGVENPAGICARADELIGWQGGFAAMHEFGASP